MNSSSATVESNEWKHTVIIKIQFDNLATLVGVGAAERKKLSLAKWTKTYHKDLCIQTMALPTEEKMEKLRLSFCFRLRHWR